MKNNKKRDIKAYIAVAKTINGLVWFVFFSEYRGNSKANIEDAQKAFQERYGYEVQIMDTFTSKRALIHELHGKITNILSNDKKQY